MVVPQPMEIQQRPPVFLKEDFLGKFNDKGELLKPGIIIGTIKGLENRDDVPHSDTLIETYQKDHNLISSIPGNNTDEMRQCLLYTKEQLDKGPEKSLQVKKLFKKASLRKNIAAGIGYGLMGLFLFAPPIVKATSSETNVTPGAVNPAQVVENRTTNASFITPKTAKTLGQIGIGMGMGASALMLFGTNFIKQREESFHQAQSDINQDQLKALAIWYNQLIKGMIEWQNMQNNQDQYLGETTDVIKAPDGAASETNTQLVS